MDRTDKNDLSISLPLPSIRPSWKKKEEGEEWFRLLESLPDFGDEDEGKKPQGKILLLQLPIIGGTKKKKKRRGFGELNPKTNFQISNRSEGGGGRKPE